MTVSNSALPSTLDWGDLTDPVTAELQVIGDGFSVLAFNYRQFSGLMDPLVKVDNFSIFENKITTNPLAGILSVLVVFEDSTGKYRAQNSAGAIVELQPGDLYWTQAGRGSLLNEELSPSGKVHALRIIINLPKHLKQKSPTSRHVKATQMPILEGNGYRVRLVLGTSNGTKGLMSPSLPLTILEGTVSEAHQFTHDIEAGHSVWLYVAQGEVNAHFGKQTSIIRKGCAIAYHANHEGLRLAVNAVSASHFVLIQGMPLHENFFQKGSFVMSTLEELERVEAAYAAGHFGLAPPPD
ncbi:pirin-like C-terminal cupin domain-containing protein [Flexibacterium corallicola]|uniref:pirin-like C-terminal cupin domain-containing protein n=1 Tax=Flexibacterium corallicola TaxID=3037259 RepID=UPI00286EFBF9|nr:pirin-like C-terminal cupin domain-containing protein [Pseudovibrio sp. M1P-2-3]